MTESFIIRSPFALVAPCPRIYSDDSRTPDKASGLEVRDFHMQLQLRCEFLNFPNTKVPKSDSAGPVEKCLLSLAGNNPQRRMLLRTQIDSLSSLDGSEAPILACSVNTFSTRQVTLELAPECSATHVTLD